ncbi:uncharacterized protein KD926_010670 [Aspergillus affinis]|uniref:uncharacterized protein n=1 Tax=Aspergillus affinis TaxID=1070780 RepID=UPI0022FF1171|nr:uncharacterized protein KD926_010670 [Aspergillus affinis]KAI9038541.1 hypothetical protein KD926_010670 [Aspergillus affinis]
MRRERKKRSTESGLSGPPNRIGRSPSTAPGSSLIAYSGVLPLLLLLRTTCLPLSLLIASPSPFPFSHSPRVVLRAELAERRFSTMNNNREERRQMRQRGAATRKIKEVDFDFSFGLAPPPEEPSEPASQSELANGPPGPSAPSEPESSQPPLESAKQNTPPPLSRSSSQRTPRFDVLADEAPDLGRSSKRRKIDSPPTNRRISPRRSSPLQNGTQTTPPVQPPNEPIEVPTATNATEYEIQTTETVATSPIANNAPTESPQDVPKPAPKPSENGSEPIPELASKPAPVPQDLNRNSPEQQPVQAPEPSPEQLPHEDPTDVPTTEPENQMNGVPYSNHVEPKSPPAQQTVSQPIDNSSPADSTRSKRKRGTRADQHSPQSASPVAKEDAPQAALPPQSEDSIDSPGDKRKTRGASAGGRSNASPEITDHSAQPPAQLSPPEQSLEAPAEQRKTRGANGGVRLSKSASPKSIDKSIRPSPRVSTPEQSVDVSAREGKQQGANARARSSKSASPRSVDESAQQPPQDATPDQPLEVSTSKGKTRGVRAGARSAQSGSPDLGNETAQQTKQASQTEEPRKATRGKRKRRGSSASGRTPPQSVNTLGTADKEVEHPPPEEAQDTPAETVPSEPQPAKRQRGRPQRAAQKSPAPGEEPAEKAVGSPGNNSAKESSPPRREPRGPRNRNVRKPTPEPAAEEEEPAAQPTQVEGGPETNATNHDESRQSHQKSKAAADKKPKRTGRGEKTAEPAKMSEEIPRPGRKGKKARKAQEQEQTQERESEPEPEPEVEPERATERQPEVEPEPEPSTRKRGQGKPSQSKKDGKTPQPEERATQDNVEEATTSRPKRKPRQPRGETVPVTVHRLANVASLGGAPLAGTSSDEEEDDENDQETAEELSTRLKAKLPNRGGVNVADVLSQICRETLEKTLTTLNNGIDNEGIAARRSEWARKKKAVEAYGTELEGRLYELSEMLDSNFVLGVQLRKSKREMLDQRTRLFQLRKEREAVALRMDAVRQKHSEEENARATRSTINHSLHNIDLALERSKKPQPQPADSTIPQDPSSSTSSPTIGLEFLLRNVAENASSRASGAQGGLLSQIRAFNAQLESTARRLES